MKTVESWTVTDTRADFHIRVLEECLVPDAVEEILDRAVGKAPEVHGDIEAADRYLADRDEYRRRFIRVDYCCIKEDD